MSKRSKKQTNYTQESKDHDQMILRLQDDASHITPILLANTISLPIQAKIIG